MYNKVLTGILVVLLVAIVGTLGYLGINYYGKYKQEKDAEKYLEESFDTIVTPVNVEEPALPEQEENQKENPGEIEQNTGTGDNQNQNTTGTNNKVPAYYKGYRVAGKLEMPTIGKQFPILDEAENANSIEVSVVKTYGPELNTPGNVIIGGHNYNNGTFFSRNKNLKIGDKIYITDLSGKRLSYTIFSKYYSPEGDNSWFNKQFDGQTVVTLYTCDATGANRLIVCAKAD